MERLLEERKLSLVVDLDQTVLHATVDPSVHEWLHDTNHPLHCHTEVIGHFINHNYIVL
jgi:RNA polymerase II subunit A-like phosphatase